MEGKQIALLGEISRLLLERETGELCVRSASCEKRVYFEEGRIIFAVSNLDQDSLGHLLVEAEKITQEQLAQAEKERSSETRLGTILVWKGFLSPEDLYWGIKFQATRIIYSLFNLEDFEYSFTARGLSKDEVLRLNFQTPNIVMEGARRVGTVPSLRSSLPPRSYVRYVDGPETGRIIDFLPKEKEILPLLNGRYTIQKLLGLGLMEEQELYRMLNGLLVLRRLGVSKEPATGDAALAIPAAAVDASAVRSDPGLVQDFLRQEAEKLVSLQRERASGARLARWGTVLAACCLCVAAVIYVRLSRSSPGERPATPAPSAVVTAPPVASPVPAPAPLTTPPPPQPTLDTAHPPQNLVPATPGPLRVEDFRIDPVGNSIYIVHFALANAATPGNEYRGFLFAYADGQVVYPVGFVGDPATQFARGDRYTLRFRRLTPPFQFHSALPPAEITVIAFGEDGRVVLRQEFPGRAS